MNFIEIENKLINLDTITQILNSNDEDFKATIIYTIDSYVSFDDPDGKIYNMLKDRVIDNHLMLKEENE